MTSLESDVNTRPQSLLSVLSAVLASDGISAFTWAMHLVKFGGSLGTITGSPGACAACVLASTYIQWLNAWVMIGLPATVATELPGMPLPQPATATAMATKKAPSAGMVLNDFIRPGRW